MDPRPYVRSMVGASRRPFAVARPTALVLLSLVPLLASGCAALARRSLEKQYRNQELEVAVYPVRVQDVSAALWELLQTDGYPSAKYDPVDHVYRTTWSCGHILQGCDALVISVEALGEGASQVRIIRHYVEDRDDNGIVDSERAFDLEWALMSRVAPDKAKSLELAAREKADLRLANPVP